MEWKLDAEAPWPLLWRTFLCFLLIIIAYTLRIATRTSHIRCSVSVHGMNHISVLIFYVSDDLNVYMSIACLSLISEVSEGRHLAWLTAIISASETVPEEALNNYLFNKQVNEWVSDCFKKQTSFKVCIEFVTIVLLFYAFFFFWPQGMWGS